MGKVFDNRDRHYTYSFLYQGRTPKSLGELNHRKRWRRYGDLYLYCNGEYLGKGELTRVGNKNLSTGSVGLEKKHQRKGHGIKLYLAFIQAARRIGAKKLYSDFSLNKFSKRMWDEKLATRFVVKKTVNCKKACRHCQARVRRYITL